MSAELCIPGLERQAGSARIRRVVFSEAQIRRRVGELGDEISAAYPAAEAILLIGVLKGSFVFLADLVRRIQRPVHVDFLAASSYGDKTVSSGRVRILQPPSVGLAGKNVILVEDIVDSGNTLRALLPRLSREEPKSLEVCSLLRKEEGRVEPEPKWIGFEAPPEFLVGYGLDYAGRFRHLPCIAAI